MKYDWNEDTMYHFKFISSYINIDEVTKQVEEFVDICCQLEDGDTEEKLVKDLISKIYENR